VFRRLFAALGIRGTASQASPPRYKDPACNVIYNLLFCDDIELFRAGEHKESQGPWLAVLAENLDSAALREMAEDPAQESRLRVLAYNRLREAGEPVPAKKLLGAIIEMSFDEGLDVLAAFPDGRLRYINHSEKMAVFEASPPDIEAKIKKLLEVSQPAVNRLRPWDQARLAPPAKGIVRMTFLVSDGLYFGHGPFDQMQKDPMGGPILAASTDLLQAVVDATIRQQETPDKSR
jgi:hypothetical protein